MRRITLALAVGSLVAAALLISPPGSKPAGYDAVLGAGAGAAEAAVIVPILPRDPACRRVCLTSATGAKYCGTGLGTIGCKSIVNNRCIYTLCAIDPVPDPELDL